MVFILVFIFHFHKSDTKFWGGFEKYSDAHLFKNEKEKLKPKPKHPTKYPTKHPTKYPTKHPTKYQSNFGQPAPEGRFSPPLGERGEVFMKIG
jgi:hypothetical protein